MAVNPPLSPPSPPSANSGPDPAESHGDLPHSRGKSGRTPKRGLPKPSFGNRAPGGRQREVDARFAELTAGLGDLHESGPRDYTLAEEIEETWPASGGVTGLSVPPEAGPNIAPGELTPRLNTAQKVGVWLIVVSIIAAIIFTIAMDSVPVIVIGGLVSAGAAGVLILLMNLPKERSHNEDWDDGAVL